MAPFAGKRKRVDFAEQDKAKRKAINKNTAAKWKPGAPSPSPITGTGKPEHKVDSRSSRPHRTDDDVTIQIITGDYERVIHGLTATIPAAALTSKENESSTDIPFSETFLLATHTASIRCLAISPKAENNKRFLATGSADERINVYSISTTAPAPTKSKAAPTLNGSIIAENTSNRSLGSLMHHDRAVTRLEFPTKGKLFSAAEDNIVAISRTRDWTMLSSVKAPIPKVQGRPSGDTASPGEVPTGVNDFAIHPSQKLMLSVSKGERCMRLWNLMTGKKAGVLNFDRELLQQVGEGKHSSGEGRRVLWDSTGEHYLVGFERGAAFFGIDSKPRVLCRPPNPTKLHQYAMVSGLRADPDLDTLVVSTEDGRLLFYDAMNLTADAPSGGPLPCLECIAQIGGVTAGVSSRVKDFVVISAPVSDVSAFVVAASSDGSLRVWAIHRDELDNKDSAAAAAPKTIGRLLAMHQTQSRITCVGAFLMDGIEQVASHIEPDVVNGAASEEDDSD